MIRQQEAFNDAPVTGNRQMHHGLTQLGAVSRVLDEVQLVDDIHEVVQLGHTPENAVETQPKLPGVLAPISMGQKIGFAQVRMRAPRVGAVVAIERGYGETRARGDVAVEGRFNDQPTGA